MKKRQGMAVVLTLLMLLTAMMPVSGAVAEQTATVIGGWLILRQSPSVYGAIIASYPTGTVVTLTGKNGDWYAVRTPDGRTGYMLGDYLKLGGATDVINAGTGTSTAYITSPNGLNVRLRSGPGTGYTILGAYRPGTVCTLLSAGSTWSRIQIGAVQGYMMTRYLTNSKPVIPPVPTMQPSATDKAYDVYVTSRNGKGVNLRSGPGKMYDSIGFYSVGTAAQMLTQGNIWSYIRIGNRYGYMMTQFLSTSVTVIDPSGYTGSSYVVSANGRNVNLRTAPSTGSHVIASYKAGTRLNVITRGTDWYFVQIGGLYGYMMRQFIYDGGTPATFTDLKN